MAKEQEYEGEGLDTLELDLSFVRPGAVKRVHEKIENVLGKLGLDHDPDTLSGESFEKGEFTCGDFRDLWLIVAAVYRELDRAKYEQEKRPRA